MQENDNSENGEDNSRGNEVFSKSVRAGKRTYFFDVKSTRANDYYLTITESKRRFANDGSGKFFYEKHKVFLYKEDFEKFLEGLNESVDKIRELKAEQGEEIVEKVTQEFTDVSFDDLGDK